MTAESLSDDILAAMRDRSQGIDCAREAYDSAEDVPRLLAEVDRLRAELRNEGQLREAYQLASELALETNRELRAENARLTAQGRVSGPETTGGHPSESTAVPGRPGPVQGSEVPDVDGWTIYPTTDGGLMVSHDTDADRPTLAADDSIPLAAVLAFIADADEETPEPGERTE